MIFSLFRDIQYQNSLGVMSTIGPGKREISAMNDLLFDIRSKSIVVAGAGSGLGRAIARALVARGACVTVADISADSLAPLGRELGKDALTCPTDITNEKQADALMARAAERFGVVDGVINTAGVLRIAPALEMKEATFRESMDINVTGAFLLSRAAARAMQSRGGRIIHFASVSSFVSNVNYAAYATSKAALWQLTRVLAREWAPKGITVNSIGPAMTETGMTVDYMSDDAFRTQALASIPMGRLGSPDDLIGMVVLLLAPAGAFITGQTLYIDGGRTLV